MAQELKEKIQIVVDSREQRPYFADGRYDGRTCRTIKKLESGDYSLLGYENQIAIERKSLADLYNSLTWDRERFKNEFERLRDYEFSCVMVEAPKEMVLHPPKHLCQSNANPWAIWQSILAWMTRYPTRWLFEFNREYAEATTFDLLRHLWNRKQADQEV